MQKDRVKELCVAAFLTAVICLMTFLPKIPIPLGYAHLGDAFIVLAVFLAGKRSGIWAAGIGSALADLFSGFPLWILPTLIIKAVMAWIMGSMMYEDGKRRAFYSLPSILSVILAMLFMVAGYTVIGALLYGGMAAGLSSTPGLLIKAALNTVIALVLGRLLEKTKITSYLN